MVGDVIKPDFLIGPLPPNAWQKVVAPLADLGVADGPGLTDFFLQDITGIDVPTFLVDDVRLEAAPPPAAVKVEIDAKNRLRRVDARIFGVNTAVWDAVFDTPTTAGLLDELDIQALRFPGGSLSDLYHWKTGTTEDGYAWATSFDAPSVAQLS
jgi:hypothetical protein